MTLWKCGTLFPNAKCTNSTLVVPSAFYLCVCYGFPNMSVATLYTGPFDDCNVEAFLLSCDGLCLLFYVDSSLLYQATASFTLATARTGLFMKCLLAIGFTFDMHCFIS